MSYQTKWLQQLTLSANTSTGALLVDVSEGLAGNPVSADGTAAFSTSADTAATLLTHPGGGRVLRKLTVHNLGTAAMLISVDGGTAWFYHPGNFSQTYDVACTVDVQAKNAVAGANISSCYRSAS